MDQGIIVALIGGAVAFLGLLGGVVKWATDKFAQVQNEVARLRDSNTSLDRELTVTLLRMERFRLAFQMVATELHRKSPGNSALALAKSLLDEAFKIDPDLPGDMREQLAEIDRLTN